MSNDYFTDTSTAADFTRARASAVNTLSAAVEAAFDLLPAVASLNKVVKPAVTPGGTANALTITNTNAVASYATGQKIAFKAAYTNSGAATVNVDGLGVKNLLRPDGSNLVAADLTAGRMYEATYDGTAFQLHTNLLDLSEDGVGSYIASISASALAAASSATDAENAQTAAESAQTAAEVAQAAAEAAAASLTASGLLTSIKTVDGSGSGLDTDLVRGTTPGAFGLTMLATATAAAAQTALFSSQAVFPAGTVSAPGISVSGDTNTGIYFSAADVVDITAGGVNRMSIAAAAITTTVVAQGPDGSASLPAFAFSGDVNTGIYRSTTDTLNITTGGTSRVAVNTASVTSTLPFLAPDGNSSAPGFAFSGQTNVGMYRSSGSLVLAVGGNPAVTLASGTAIPTFHASKVIIESSSTPASSGATGTAGTISWDTSYLYVCVSANTWKRLLLSSF